MNDLDENAWREAMSAYDNASRAYNHRLSLQIAIRAYLAHAPAANVGEETADLTKRLRGLVAHVGHTANWDHCNLCRAVHACGEAATHIDALATKVEAMSGEIERLAKERDESDDNYNSANVQRIKAENRAQAAEAAEIEALAFEMPPPNGYTPRFMQIAVGMRGAISSSPGDLVAVPKHIVEAAAIAMDGYIEATKSIRQIARGKRELPPECESFVVVRDELRALLPKKG